MSGLRSVLLERVADPVAGALRRVPLSARLAEFRADQWDDPGTLRPRQAGRLSDLLIHATTRVPFYMRCVRGLTPDAIVADPWGSLASFPVLEREHVSEHLDELTCEMGRGTMSWSTGGSTGRPVRLRRDRRYLAAALATTWLLYEWAGIRRGDWHVKLWGARRDFSGRDSLAGRLTDLFYTRATLDAYRMDAARRREYVRFLKRRPPVCLEGYADALYELADFIGHEGLAVPSPRAVVTSAGTLHPHMRARIEEVFRAPVFDRYGCREAGNMAGECERHNGLHVFGETTILELIDSEGREVGEGETGEILVTNLWNFTMPLIRYRVGDEAVRGAARCGSRCRSFDIGLGTRPCAERRAAGAAGPILFSRASRAGRDPVSSGATDRCSRRAPSLASSVFCATPAASRSTA